MQSPRTCWSMTMRFFLLSFLSFTLLSLHLTSQEKRSVALCMVVKNEGGMIKKCLQSVKPFISYWEIVDVGSKDGTCAIVKETLHDIPGELLTESWEDLEKTYTRALQSASSHGEYVFWMSADQYLEYASSFQLPELTKDVYSITHCKSKKKSLHRQIIKSQLPWRWRFCFYPYLTCDEICSSAPIEGLRSIATESIVSEEEKFALSPYPKTAVDEQVFKEAIGRAKEYKEAKDFSRALEWYQKAFSVAKTAEGAYEALVNMAYVEEALEYPAGVIQDGYYRAYILCPDRAEAVYYLAKFYNKQQKYDLAYDWIHSRNYISKIKSTTPFDDMWIEEWGIPFELSIAAYWVGRYGESIALCDKLLLEPELPANVKKQVPINKEFCLKKLQR